MDLPVQNGFEKPDNGRVGGHHSREPEASPMQKDLSVLWSDIAKPVFPVVGIDTTRVLVHNRVCVRLGWTHYGCLVNSRYEVPIFMLRGVPAPGTWQFCRKFSFEVICRMISPMTNGDA